MDEEQMEALVDAFKAVIDARLIQLGLITDRYKAPIKGKPKDAEDDEPADDDDAEEEAKPKKGKGKPDKSAKPAKPGKGKQKEPEHDFDEVKEKMIELVKERDKQTAIDALTRFGCKKLSDLRKDQYDEFFEYAQKFIDNEEEDPSDAEDLFGGDDD
jgi:hypothetical protein